MLPQDDPIQRMMAFQNRPGNCQLPQFQRIYSPPYPLPPRIDYEARGRETERYLKQLEREKKDKELAKFMADQWAKEAAESASKIEAQVKMNEEFNSRFGTPFVEFPYLKRIREQRERKETEERTESSEYGYKTLDQYPPLDSYPSSKEESPLLKMMKESGERMEQQREREEEQERNRNESEESSRILQGYYLSKKKRR